MLYKNKDWLKAAAVYTKAIKLDPENAVLYSNRSAAFLQLLKVQKALADAEMSINIQPKWEKGYYRKGCALEAMEKFEEALQMFREAADHNPKNTEVISKMANMNRHVSALKRKQAGQTGSGFQFQQSKQTSKGASKEEEARGAPRGLASEEDYEAAKGGLKLGERIEYSGSAVEAWAKQQMSEAVALWAARKMVPAVTFMPGRKDQDGDHIQGQVTVQQAFESPDTLEDCCQFLRKYAQDTACHATCLVVPRSTIAFPQVWKKSGWKFGSQSGFFCQVESREISQMWFVPSSEEKGRCVPKNAVSLDVDTFRVLPPLIPKIQ